MNDFSRKRFTLIERTTKFASDVRLLVKPIFQNAFYRGDIQQLLRASGSVAANYIEANEGLSKKDFLHRLKICRKEAKECMLWLRLIDVTEIDQENKKNIYNEAHQLLLIFNSMIRKTESL